MSLRSPLGRVRGLGSAKEGLTHWSHQRLTAILLVPLSIWFIVSAISLAGSSYEQFHAWVSVPGNTALLVVMLAAIFYHGQLGLQVVIEDYVHGTAAKSVSLIALKLATVVVGVFTVLAVLRTAFVGG